MWLNHGKRKNKVKKFSTSKPIIIYPLEENPESNYGQIPLIMDHILPTKIKQSIHFLNKKLVL